MAASVMLSLSALGGFWQIASTFGAKLSQMDGHVNSGINSTSAIKENRDSKPQPHRPDTEPLAPIKTSTISNRFACKL
jgi:hypothetical protein